MESLISVVAPSNPLWQFIMNWVWPIFLLLAGLGFVIFVHELGHFLVAKAVGIKVERFSLGMGPKLLGFTRGDTEYWLAAVPIGGYVKMLGQEDFKALEDGVKDPRAFNNKPVWARLCVVSAGVVMNIIFAAVLFVVAGLIGVEFPRAVVGDVKPGYPAANAQIAWGKPIPVIDDVLYELSPTAVMPASQPTTTSAQTATAPAFAATPTTSPGFYVTSGPSVINLDQDADAVWPAASTTTSAPAPKLATNTVGLEPGDDIMALNGEPQESFSGIHIAGMLATPDDAFGLTVQRTIDGKTYIGKTTLKAKFSKEGTFPQFGISTPLSTVIEEADEASPFAKGDRITAINGKEITSYWQIQPEVEKALGTELTVTVERDGKPLELKFDPAVYGGDYYTDTDYKKPLEGIAVKRLANGIVTRSADGEKTYSLDDLYAGELLDILGMVPRIKAGSVSPGTPADKAGMKPGDIFVNYADSGSPTLRGIHKISDENAGKPVALVLDRDGQANTVEIKPDAPKKGAPHATLGFAAKPDLSHLVIAGVRPDSPAAKADVLPGDEILAVNDESVKTWPGLFNRLRDLQGQEVTLTLKRNQQEVTAAIGMLDAGKFDPLLYSGGSPLASKGMAAPKVARVKIIKTNPIAAISWGVRETWNFTISNYVGFRSLAKGYVPTSEIRGPLGIGSMAVATARMGFSQLVYFMAFISVALAVMNFLPIPVVDGGHVVFLIIEKIKGSPLSIRAMNIAQVAGLVLLGCLVLYACWNDVVRWIGGQV